jgi:hypothetical protein
MSPDRIELLIGLVAPRNKQRDLRGGVNAPDA